ncbi:hypothetical protein BDA99DRAFT_497568 [Phascolomyces articulosus]|uniref:Uncharacterized protein n=1 Tax=Phascolomyces articulosus TaxID=60185 RepID=A0AAD5PHY7_9FUNG|nr:hypothetical protein BDA99DRAFT_497568 [Phascolomyces articulosus]
MNFWCLKEMVVKHKNKGQQKNTKLYRHPETCIQYQFRILTYIPTDINYSLEIYPDVAFLGSIPEMNLCISYLNQALSSLFATLCNQLRLLNSKMEKEGATFKVMHLSSSRSDATVSKIPRIYTSTSFIFGKAKSSHMLNDSYLLSKNYLLRLRSLQKMLLIKNI